MAYKTPGVYVEEISKFPPSIAAVETATPAFVGYTEKALDKEQNSLLNKPTKIDSLLEFEEHFGGPYSIESYTVEVDTTSNNKIESIAPDKRFYLYDSLRIYFDNGGGKCYIVSVGSFTDSVIYEDVSTPSDPRGLKVGVEKLFQFDEPTMILFPDAVNLLDAGDPDYVSFGSLQKGALKQCYDLKDRFVIMDIMEGYNEDTIDDELDNFRTNVGTLYLKYGAVYHPWLKSNYTPELKFSQLAFEQPDETPISDLSIFSNGDTDLQALVTRAEAVSGDVDDIIADIKANSVSFNLKRGEKEVNNYLIGLHKLLIANTAPITNFTHYMNLLANLATVYAKLDGNVEDELQEDIDRLKDDTDLIDAITDLVAVEKHGSIQALTSSGRDDTNLSTVIYTDIDGNTWLNVADYATVTANDETLTTNLDFIGELEDVKKKLVSTFISFYDIAQHYGSLAENDLFEGHTFFKGVYDRVVEQMSLLPPSAALAGVYCAVDNTRGVWKAPANHSLANVLAPAIKITDADQSELNVHTTGKSINCIRAFTGKGIMVWGARTLAGNDNEWRYVNVRRFFNMVEESVKKATEQFVFEPNDANTWVKVRAMIENFLIIQWRAGALAGAKPEHAFYVKVGLGETMTSLDILEGRMNVEIGMAAVRPAEFIVLKFSHKMQEA